MFEYEFIQQRAEDLRRQARHDRLVLEAVAANAAGHRPGLLQRLAGSRRPLRAVTTEPRRARLSEC